MRTDFGPEEYKMMCATCNQRVVRNSSAFASESDNCFDISRGSLHVGHKKNIFMQHCLVCCSLGYIEQYINSFCSQEEVKLKCRK